ncbi:calmodulin-beta-like [Toxorhynchites rutilus septentrionalis]|uniref:calmodulin-beta-like n=1 Tax=Toxorhynchites rutilus septentrionalis TaxID=329112 RepID=UPI002479862B|nr:calmodulin-beta-like [Toxorhynchites rutilus septentrionalis]
MSAYSLSEQQENQFKQMFEKFDTDGNGSITTSELGLITQALGLNPSKEEMEQMIHEVDLDGSGTIELNEFMVLMARMCREEPSEDELRQAFKVFDKNGDGFLTVDELSAVMQNFGEGLSDDEFANLLREADVDEDGKINYNEFAALLLR